MDEEKTTDGQVSTENTKSLETLSSILNRQPRGLKGTIEYLNATRIDTGIDEDMREQHNLIRAALKEAFPVPEDIDDTRVAAFLDSYGVASDIPYFIASRKDLLDFFDDKDHLLELSLYGSGVLKSLGAFFDPVLKMHACYNSALGLIVISRDTDMEELNGGAIHTEATLVHELVHSAASAMGDDTQSRFGPLKRRRGYQVDPELFHPGEFLSEGLAEYVASLYRMKFTDDKVIDEKGELINEPSKRGRYLSILLNIANEDDIVFKGLSVLNIDSKDGNVRKWGEATIGKWLSVSNDSAFPAFVIHLICQKDPTFLKKLISGQESTTELRSLYIALEKVAPGFYDTFRQDFVMQDAQTQRVVDLIRAK